MFVLSFFLSIACRHNHRFNYSATIVRCLCISIPLATRYSRDKRWIWICNVCKSETDTQMTMLHQKRWQFAHPTTTGSQTLASGLTVCRVSQLTMDFHQYDCIHLICYYVTLLVNLVWFLPLISNIVIIHLIV